MRARSLLLIGAILGVANVLVGLAISAASDPPDPEWDSQMLDVPLIVGGLSGLILLGLLAFLTGWFGRDRDDAVLIALGLSAVVLVTLIVLVIRSGGPPLSVLVVFGIYAVIAWVVARVAYLIGDMFCDVRGLATMGRLTAPAFTTEIRGDTAWTTTAGPAIRRQFAELARRHGAGDAASAQAVGIRMGLPRDRAVLVMLVAERLVIAPVTLEGEPLGEPTVLTGADIAQVSIRSEAADGSRRREVNAYDDVIEVRTRAGTRIRLRLPYGTRGAGTSTGGPEVIRTWLRTSAATYV